MTKRHRPRGYDEHGLPFESAQAQMAEEHFFVVRGFFPPPPPPGSPEVGEGDFATRLKQYMVDELGDPAQVMLFNGGGAPGGGPAGDGLRFQVSVAVNEWPVEFAAFFASWKLALEALMPGRAAQDMVVLFSRAGCAAQTAHSDWPAGSLDPRVAQLGDDGLFGGFPAGCLLALEPDTALLVWPRSSCMVDPPAPPADHYYATVPPTRVPLEPGDLLVFRADCVHAGAAYPGGSNVRLHAYADRRGIKRGKDETFHMQ